MRLWAAALLLLHCLFGTANGVQSAFDQIFALDCAGTLHVAPSSPLATTMQTPFTSLYKLILDRVEARITKHCDGHLPDFDDFFDPVAALLYAAQRGAQDAPSCVKYSRSTFGLIQLAFGQQFEGNLPETCSYSTYKQGKGCLMETKFDDIGASLQLAIKKCPGTEVRHPYISVTCSGVGCQQFQPCTSNDNCGAPDMLCYTTDDPHSYPSKTAGVLGNILEGTLFQRLHRPSVPALLTQLWNTATEHGFFPAGSPIINSTFGFCSWDKIEKGMPWDRVINSRVTWEVDQSGCSQRLKVNVDPTSTWDGQLDDGSSVFDWNRMSGEKWGRLKGRPGSITALGLNCDGTGHIFGSERFGVQVTMPALEVLVPKFVEIMEDIWDKQGLSDFVTQQAPWTLDLWTCLLFGGEECMKNSTDSLLRGLGASHFSMPSLFDTKPDWPQLIDHTTKIVTQALTDHFNQHASFSDKVKVSLGLKEAYPGLSETVKKFSYLKDAVVQFLELSSSSSPDTVPLSTQFSLYYGARLEPISTCTPTIWKEVGVCAVKATGLSDIVGSDAQLTAVATRCGESPHGLPSVRVECTGGLCDGFSESGLICTTDTDCTKFGSGYSCKQLLETDDLKYDLIGRLLWEPLKEYCTKPEVDGANCECDPIAAGIGTDTWNSCKADPLSCALPLLSSFLANDSNTLWKLMTGHNMPNGGPLNICQSSKLNITNGVKTGFGLKESQLHPYGIPSNKLREPVGSYYATMDSVTMDTFLNNMQRWYSANLNSSSLPNNVLEAAATVDTDDEGILLLNFMTNVMTARLEKTFGHPINPNGFQKHTWLANGSVVLYFSPMTSKGTLQQQAELLKGDHLLGLLNKQLNLTNVHMAVQEKKSNPQYSVGHCAPYNATQCLLRSYCKWAASNCTHRIETYVNISGVVPRNPKITDCYMINRMEGMQDARDTFQNFACSQPVWHYNDSISISVMVNENLVPWDERHKVVQALAPLFQEWGLPHPHRWGEGTNKRFEVVGLDSLLSIPQPLPAQPPPPPPTRPPPVPSPSKWDKNGATTTTAALWSLMMLAACAALFLF